MEPLELLKAAESVAFIDWAHQDMVGDVLRTGRTVYGHTPAGFGVHEIVEESDDDNVRRFPLRGGGFLKMTSLGAPPEHIDLVVTYRPSEEQPHIVEMSLLAGAKSFWVHPPATVSDDARKMCADAGVAFVEGVDIRDVVAAS